MNKFGLMVATSVVVTVLTPTMALAAPLRMPMMGRDASTSARAENQDNRIANLKTKADAEINRRLTSLNDLITGLNASTKLSATDKSNALAEAQAELTNLTTLKTKIDGDSDLTTLRADVQSIVKDYRVYALILPKDGLLRVADVILTATDKFADISTRLQSLGGAQGDKYTEMQAKVADAKQLAQAAETEVLPLKPQDYPNNRTTLQDARQKLQTARQDLVTARQDLQAIVQGLKAAKASASPTATP